MSSNRVEMKVGRVPRLFYPLCSNGKGGKLAAQILYLQST